jgi:hypothetical protein
MLKIINKRLMSEKSSICDLNDLNRLIFITERRESGHTLRRWKRESESLCVYGRQKEGKKKLGNLTRGKKGLQKENVKIWNIESCREEK